VETPVLILSALGQVDDRVKGCGPAVTTTLPSHTLFPSFWRGSKLWHAAAAAAVRRPFIGSAIWNSTAVA